VLGVPASPGAAGWFLLAAGAAAAVVALFVLRRRAPQMPPTVAASAVAITLTAAMLPFVGWRFLEDLRVTTGLHGYDASAAGPIQAYLPGYLVDGAQRLIPRGATYATVVSRSVPWQPARAAFSSLAVQTLFPRRSVQDPQTADYVVAWGVRPTRVVRVTRVWVVRPRTGLYAAVYVGKVARR
jgi:hypothetical protein